MCEKKSLCVRKGGVDGFEDVLRRAGYLREARAASICRVLDIAELYLRAYFVKSPLVFVFSYTWPSAQSLGEFLNLPFLQNFPIGDSLRSM